MLYQCIDDGIAPGAGADRSVSSKTVPPKEEKAMAERSLHDEMDSLKEDMAKLQGDVGDLLGLIKEIGAEKVAETRSTLRDGLDEQRERLWDAVGRAREQGQRRVNDLEDQITEHPLGSLFAAFGLGYIIAKLGGRSESSR